MRASPPPRSSTRIDCALVPLHVHSWMFVPSAVPALATSRHLPGLASAPKLYVPLATRDRRMEVSSRPTMTRFEGFAAADAKFFKSLAKKNERPWFLAHKAEFEEGYNAPMKALLTDVRDAIDSKYAHCDLDEPKV